MKKNNNMSFMILIASICFFVLFINGYGQAIESIKAFQRIEKKSGYEKVIYVYSHNSEWDVSNEYIKMYDDGGYGISYDTGDVVYKALRERQKKCEDDARSILKSEKYNNKSIAYNTFMTLGNGTELYEVNFILSYSKDLFFDVYKGYAISKDEFNKGKKGCLIGGAMKGLAYTRNNRAYITVAGNEYEVTGILESRDIANEDFRVIVFDNEINYNSYVINDVANRLYNGLYCGLIEYSYNHTGIIEDDEDVYFRNEMYCVEGNTESRSGLTDITEGGFTYYLRLVIIGFMLLFSVIICVLISNLYIKKQSKNIAIMRAFGMPAHKVYCNIMKGIILTVILGAVLSAVGEIAYFLITGNVQQISKLGILIPALGVIIVAAFFIVVSIYSVILIKKSSIVESLREL